MAHRLRFGETDKADGALARLPAEARGRACICPLCAREQPAAPQAPAPVVPNP